MKINYSNDENGGFAFAFMCALARVTDNSNGFVELYRNNELIGSIQPTTKDWWTLKDILKYYRWENYPSGDFGFCCMFLEDVCLIFDEFREFWI